MKNTLLIAAFAVFVTIASVGHAQQTLIDAIVAVIDDQAIFESDIEQTIRQKLPKGFQRSEFLLDHGAIDMIIHRAELRHRISSLLQMITYYSKAS